MWLSLALQCSLDLLFFPNFLAPGITLELYHSVCCAPFQVKPLAVFKALISTSAYPQWVTYAQCWVREPRKWLNKRFAFVLHKEKQILLFWPFSMPKILTNGVLYFSSTEWLQSLIFNLERIINNPVEKFTTKALFTASSRFHCIKQLCILKHWKEIVAQC